MKRLMPVEAGRENFVILVESDRTGAVCGKGPAQCKNLESASTARNSAAKKIVHEKKEIKLPYSIG